MRKKETAKLLKKPNTENTMNSNQKTFKMKKIYISILCLVILLSGIFVYIYKESRVFTNSEIKENKFFEGKDDSFIIKQLYPMLNSNNDSIEINLIKDMKAEDIQWCLDNRLGDAEIQNQNIEVQEKTADISMKIFAECLFRKGYKKPSEDIISKRSLEIFGVDISSESNERLYPLELARYVYPNSEQTERDKQQKAMESKVYFDNFHNLFWKCLILDTKSGIIVSYPDALSIVNIEGTIVKENKDGEILERIKLGDTISYDMSDPQLSLLLHANRYLFYDSKASYIWLKQNRKLFLEDLCKIYGYDTVPDINDMVIEHTCQSPDYGEMLDKYKDVFVRHNWDGSIRIHEGLLKYIAEYLNTCGESEYVSVQQMFNTYKNEMVWSIRSGIPEQFKEFSLEQRMKITAYIGYYYNNAIKIETEDPFRKELAENEDFINFIKKNNYFNLDSFPQLIERLIEEHNNWRELEQARANVNDSLE